MPTEAQLTANQANAQLSTGPRTETGKSRASQNARRHGLTAAHLVIAESELETFESMRAALAASIAPDGELEHTLFDTLLHANWNIRRCRILEAALMDGEIDPMTLEQNEANLRQLDRHARRHDSSFHRALRELKALQTERAFRSLSLAAPNEPNPEPSPLACTKTARRARLVEQAAQTRLASASLDLALARLASKPPASSHPPRVVVYT